VVPAAVIHRLWDVFAIAIANNVDNLGARIAYSIRGIKISVPINLWITVITFVISAGAALLGSVTAEFLGTAIAPVTAMVVLVALGLWMLTEPWRERRRNEHPAAAAAARHRYRENSNANSPKEVGLKEGTLLGIALSINNIGGGMSAGMLGIDPYLVGALSAVLSFLALWAGNYFALFFVSWRIADSAGTIGGLLLIGLGIKQVVG
jgi:putative sporulation protein YtaF